MINIKKIIPFKKEITFKTNISEITSISLEHNFLIENQNINGEFTVNGDYRISDSSNMVEVFEYIIPFDYKLDDIYDLSNAIVDIDDFYYEIINDNVLLISIDICIDKFKERLIINEIPNLEEKKDVIEELFVEQDNESFVSDIKKDNINQNIIKEENRCIEEDDIIPEKGELDIMENKIIIENKKDKQEDIKEQINSIFSNVGDSNIYVAYNVYIIREGDTIEKLIDKYEITEDELKKYNNLSDLKLGDKIIIPAK